MFYSYEQYEEHQADLAAEHKSDHEIYLDTLHDIRFREGADYPDRAWLATPYDMVWVANPYYTGPAVPHPEDDEDEDTGPADPHFEEDIPY